MDAVQIINTWGNGLISKRPERYSEDKWPTFYKKVKD